MNTQPVWPPLTRWSSARTLRFFAITLSLSVLAYLAIRIPGVGVSGLADDAAPYWVLKLLLDVFVLGYVAARSRWTGPKLVGALIAVYAGLQVVSFVEIYLYGMVPWSDVTAGVAGSLFQGGAVVLLVVVAFGKLRGEESPAPDDRLRLPPGEWIWKLTVLAVTFLALMILAGLVVFEGVAAFVDPHARAGYEIVEPPAWILPFQLVRGLVFTALLIPVVALLGGEIRETELTVAMLFATLLASNMIAGYDAVPGLLWVAHFFELFAQAFVYGLLAAWLLTRRHRPLRALRGRVYTFGRTSEGTD